MFVLKCFNKNRLIIGLSSFVLKINSYEFKSILTLVIIFVFVQYFSDDVKFNQAGFTQENKQAVLSQIMGLLLTHIIT